MPDNMLGSREQLGLEKVYRAEVAESGMAGWLGEVTGKLGSQVAFALYQFSEHGGLGVNILFTVRCLK